MWAIIFTTTVVGHYCPLEAKLYQGAKGNCFFNTYYSETYNLENEEGIHCRNISVCLIVMCQLYREN